jgi:hypothetical protein
VSARLWGNSPYIRVETYNIIKLEPLSSQFAASLERRVFASSKKVEKTFDGRDREYFLRILMVDDRKKCSD